MSLLEEINTGFDRMSKVSERQRKRDQEVLDRQIRHTKRFLAELEKTKADAIAFQNTLVARRAAITLSDEDSQITADDDGHFDRQPLLDESRGV